MSHLLHSFWHVHNPATANYTVYAEPKQFSWTKLACFVFSSSNFSCAGSHTEHRWRCSCKRTNERTNERSFVPWFVRWFPSLVRKVSGTFVHGGRSFQNDLLGNIAVPFLSTFPKFSLTFSKSWLALGIHAFCTYKYALLHTFALVFPPFLSLPLVLQQSLLLFLCASLHGTLWLWTIWRLVFCECSLCS